jgi:hypothetical protein
MKLIFQKVKEIGNKTKNENTKTYEINRKRQSDIKTDRKTERHKDREKDR